MLNPLEMSIFSYYLTIYVLMRDRPFPEEDEFIEDVNATFEMSVKNTKIINLDRVYKALQKANERPYEAERIAKMASKLADSGFSALSKSNNDEISFAEKFNFKEYFGPIK